MKIPLTVALFLIGLFVVAADAQVNRHVLRERLVIQDLARISSAQATYSATHGNGEYAATLASLYKVGFIDEALASGEKHGYLFALQTVIGSPEHPPSFSITATPRVYRRLGVRSFFLSLDGLFRGGDISGRTANAQDPVLEDDACTNGNILLNEQCIVQTLRAIGGAQATYAATHGGGNYGGLGALHSQGLIDVRTASGVLRGYRLFVFVSSGSFTEASTFTVSAIPETYGATGIRSFRIDTSQVVRGADHQGGASGPEDPPVD